MIYIHIPYCRSFCTYCDFYSVIPKRGCSKFVDALCSEIGFRTGEIRSQSPMRNTLYIGGGTPSLLEAEELAGIVSACREAVQLCPGQNFDEFTVEVNPDDILQKGADYVEALVRMGVTRVSMGVQSFNDSVLKFMNRRHDASAARKACLTLRRAGVKDISLDLIFGYGPSMSQWRESVEAALDIDGALPEHISAYQLSVEEGSALAGMISRGEYALPEDEVCAEQYAFLTERLSEAGYHHYEISNFALPGHEAKHNSAYWEHVPYTGLGPAAHSLVRGEEAWIRRWNRADVKAYIDAARIRAWDSLQETETLTPGQFRTEKIMLGLRTDKGVPRSLLQGSAVDKLLEAGSLVPVSAKEKGCGEFFLRIPENRFFVSDDIISELI